ncbi:UDP-2,3-diacylglucosamine diphosphatase [Planctomycetota bacterium]
MYDRLVITADVHLPPGDSEKTTRFLDFINSNARECEAIIILGDLFEYWVGHKQALQNDYQGVLQALRQTAGFCKLYFMPGNRDYLFSRKTAKACGMEIMPDPKVVQLSEQRIFLTHGDLLCLGDVNYLRYRKFIQHPCTKIITRLLPLGILLKIAQLLRERGKRQMNQKSPGEMDITPAAAQKVFADGADVLICGHVHKPRQEHVEIQNRTCQLLVLGNWDGPAKFVQYANGQFSLGEWS